MYVLLRCIFVGILAAVAVAPAAWAAEPTERRFGLVIGNAEYPSGTLPTAANDAGLIAQTLQAAGFDVIGARDLDGDSLRRTFRDFADKVSGAGPDAVAFVYLNGHGLQYEGDNYFAGIDAKIDRDVDVPSHALRVNDFLRPLASLKPKALIVVMDTARENPYARTGNPLAGGMALVEPTSGTLYAFNAAPGTIAKTDTEAYGVYAQALAEMIREGGLPVNTLFDRVRLRVNEASEGASLPWHVSKIDVPFEFFERAEDAPKPEASHQVHSARRAKPIRAFDEAQEAYFAALERDTLNDYIDFLDAYPDHRLAKRVQAIVASRREAITWRRTRNADSPNAYWTYLDLYPDGPHAWDARRRLDFLTAPSLPPPSYARFVYDDLPPPYEYEYFYVRRRSVFWFYDPVFAFAVPPPCPIFFLPPPLPRAYFAPPPRPVFVFVLPVPAYVPVQPFVRPVRNVVPPPNNLIAVNIHQTIQAPAPGTVQGVPLPGPGAPVVAGTPGGPVVTGAPGGPAAPGGHSVAAAVGAGVVAGAAAGVLAARVALPASLASKSAAVPPKPSGAATPVSGGPVLQPGQGRPLAGSTSGSTLPPGARSATVPPTIIRPTPGAVQSDPSILKPKQATGRPATQGGAPQGAPQGGASVLNPKQAPGTPTPGAAAPRGALQGGPSILAPKSATGTPAATPRDTGAADRARAEQQAQHAKDRAAEQQRATQQQRTQDEAARARRQRDLQQQQQQQQDQQRRSDQQRQQQQAVAAQQARAAQAQQLAHAQARAAQLAQAQARAAQQAQQAQAQARAQQAQAQAQARAAQAAAQQRAAAASKPKCGIQGTPPCPR